MSNSAEGPRPGLAFAPRDVFEQILEYSVIPTFDLILELPGDKGVVLVFRIIAPYRNQWALPGLRMLKPEGIDDVISRVAEDELGVKVDTKGKRFVGQFVGRFKTEHNRQDISTCYALRALGDRISLNADHFSGHRIARSVLDIPDNIGAMYKHYLNVYFGQIQ